MDLLHSRYASPFSLLDGYIQTGRLAEFVDDFTEMVNEAELYEFWLHKVWAQSFPEFKEAVENTNRQQAMTVNDIEATVQNSWDILNNFNPEKEEGEI